MAELTVGQPAPDFTLPASTGMSVTLSELRGKNIVLYFYPKDDTPGCTTQACGFRDLHSAFADLNTVILGVSPDPVKKHEKFISKYELPFILLSDEEHTVLESYGVWKEKNMYGKKYWGVERTTLLIDAEGVLRKIYPKVKVAGHVDQVMADVKAL
ncbi:thioredoxin-dependent thiol peroxidase [Tumebacillus permanentifrigoris]|uniref:thioredoxin-dependent peroxiredoxin n=1 Tax=Tumebacillus permanentifrigoris TaxID=378543 RepID=A0A316D768_9BACL|nr:thioredoxin-dependent thiol peroxidase [Tumebacillus permanentifrigoris]PWK11306.1 peroxiredoxin Q/BCP [Tumebacillus permanentifrigoris]